MDNLKKQKRSPYDECYPSPSEELEGIIEGILKANPEREVAFSAIIHWLIQHLSDEELERLEARDPSWDFERDRRVDGTDFFLEWAKRIKNGEFLEPLDFMNFSNRHHGAKIKNSH